MALWSLCHCAKPAHVAGTPASVGQAISSATRHKLEQEMSRKRAGEWTTRGRQVDARNVREMGQNVDGKWARTELMSVPQPCLQHQTRIRAQQERLFVACASIRNSLPSATHRTAWNTCHHVWRSVLKCSHDGTWRMDDEEC